MNGMMTPGMMWGISLVWLLVVAVLVLSVAALLKYLFSGHKEDRQRARWNHIASPSPRCRRLSRSRGDATRSQGDARQVIRLNPAAI